MNQERKKTKEEDNKTKAGKNERVDQETIDQANGIDELDSQTEKGRC
jgi:hypothetical protein